MLMTLMEIIAISLNYLKQVGGNDVERERLFVGAYPGRGPN